MEIPKVSLCDMTECFFNADQTCHASAINVGGSHPQCDTFIINNKHGGGMDSIAMVGACKVSSCSFNIDFSCEAYSIRVGPHSGHGDCQTYSPR